MKLIIQRSKDSQVKINNKIVGQIKFGYVLLVGFSREDNYEIIDKMVQKIVKLRLFDDEDGKINLSIKDLNGEILSISQFTLLADNSKGNRPSFTKACSYDKGLEFYQYFNEKIEAEGIKLEKGVYGADMLVEIKNDGPVTIILESEEIC